MIFKVIEIDDFSKEADISIFDGINEIVVFSHPFDLDNIKKYKLYCFNIENVYKIENKIESIKKLKTYYGYNLIGKLIDNTIIIGNFVFNIDILDIPNDINNGDFISFDIDRIDFY